ncbi:hypothetical protein EDB84DRAFT_659762 [Lactarius hengduanensis]|nr:hypothetical protein EDB84DRAFT_659762 [Lactarius hengduanensis]
MITIVAILYAFAFMAAIANAAVFSRILRERLAYSQHPSHHLPRTRTLLPSRCVYNFSPSIMSPSRMEDCRA